MNPPLRAAVIGLGVGARHAEAYAASPHARLVALCDQSAEVLRETGARFPGVRLTTRPEELLDDPGIDLISIASWDDAHRDQVVRALDQGKHVFAEKPLCLSREEAEDIRAALARHPGQRLSSNLILRCTPRFRWLREEIAGGTLGELFAADGEYNYGRVHKLTDGWRGRQPWYSVVLGGAVHLVDLLLWLTGDRVVEVTALGNRIATRGSAFRYPDYVAALLRFESGMIGRITANMGCVHPHFHGVTLYGTRATFVNGPAEGMLIERRDGQAVSRPVTAAYPGVHKTELARDFVDALHRGTEPPVTEADVFQTLEVCFAIEDSLEQGGAPVPVQLPAGVGKGEGKVTQRTIAFGRPMIGEEERLAVLAVLDGSVLTHGPVVRRFEADFAAFTGAPHAVALASCTAALHLAWFHHGIGAGDEILVPAVTHTATAHAVEYCGARPVFVDAEPDTGNLDLTLAEGLITPRTRGISVVHYLGLPVDMGRVRALAERHGLFIVEDCALSLGATYRGVHTGLWGDVGCFSFYPVKHITTAEGGMLITRDGAIADGISRERAFGIDRNIPAERKVPGMYEVEGLGFNYRLNELGAAIGVEQMRRLPGFLARRRENYEALTEALRRLEDVSLLSAGGGDFQSSYYCHSAVLAPEAAPRRVEIMREMKRRGVETSIYYPRPVPLMPFYRERYGATEQDFPVAHRLCESSIALPVGPHLEPEDMNVIADALAGAIEEVTQHV